MRRSIACAEKRADERGLADARLAGDQHDLPFAGAGCGERLVELRQFALAADHDALLPVEMERQAVKVAGGMDCRRLRDEAVAAAVQRLDVARTPGVVPQRPAQFLDTRHERCVADSRPRPERVEQLVLGDHAAAVLGEKAEQGECLRRQPQLAFALRQAAARVQTIGAECNYLIRHDYSRGQRNTEHPGNSRFSPMTPRAWCC